MAPTLRPRRQQRRGSMSSTSSSSTSPERGVDDDNDSFMLQANDSQSSLGADSPELSQDDSARRQYEEMCRVSPVARLPAELLIHIFSRLSAPKDLQSCMLVSKEWARNSVGLLWHRPAMGKWESIHSVVKSIRKEDKFFAYQDLVKRLNMSTLASGVSDGTLVGLVDCKRIERLTLTNCTKLTDISLLPLLTGNRALMALDITGLDQVTERTMMVVADNCLRLQGLNVTGCRRLTDDSIVAIAKNCRHLKRLKFNSCVQLTDKAIMTVAANSSHLLEIDLYGLQNLESPAVTALLLSCSNLREMRLAHCTRIDDSAFLNLPNDPEMPISFDALRILDLTDCNELRDKGVERIIQTCPRLRNLILAKCRNLTDRAVHAIKQLGKNLHYIHLGHCVGITDNSVEQLAKYCNRIRYIDLACCNALTDNSVMKLASLPKLKRIGLVKCAGITDRSIHALATGEIKHNRRVNGISVLERVHLSYCTNLTLDGIHNLLNNCPKLTHLSLTGVQAFLRDDLLNFCRDAPPEFNDHQRDVFCVFSGHGVTRLRDHLNNQRHYYSGSDSMTPSVVNGSEIVLDDPDDQNIDSESGTNTPVMNVNVMGTHPPGMTPVAPGPGAIYHHVGQQHNNNNVTEGAPAPGGHFAQMLFLGGLSQSAPASTAGATWGGSSTNSDGQPQPPPPPTHGHTPLPPAGIPEHIPMQHPHGHGNAQQVTGMLGATVLDDVDEGDETFGDESELMND